MYIERGKQFLDAIVEVIESTLEEKKIKIPVFAQHYLTGSDLGTVPYISIILDRIEPDLTTIGGSLQVMNIFFAITLIEKYQAEKLFTDLPMIEEALEKVEAELPDITVGTGIESIDVAFEEVGNIVLQASQITFVVNSSSYS